MIQPKRWFPLLTVVFTFILMATASCDKDDNKAPKLNIA